MGDTKFSQITSGGNLAPLTDLLLAVRSGTTDVLVTPPAGAGVFNVKDYGALGNGQKLADGTTTSGSSVISSASYTFVATDVGKCIAIFDPSNLLAAKVVTTILSVSGGNATLTSHTGITTLTGTAIIYFGTDDTVALQNAVNAANPTDSGAGGTTWSDISYGTVYLPAGIFMITSPLLWRAGVSLKGVGMKSSTLYWISTSSMGQSGFEALITGLVANGSTRIYTDIEFTDFGMDARASFITAGYNYTAKHFDIIYCIRPRFNKLFLQGSPATSIGLDYVCNGIATENVFSNCGKLWNGTSVGTEGGGTPGGGSCIDWQTNNSFAPGNYESHVISNNVFLFPGRSAIRNSDNSATLSSNFHRVISNNVVISNKTNNCGIEDDGGINVVITGNHIHCTATQASGFGIGVTCGKKGIITGNTVSGFYDGVLISDCGIAITPDQYSIRGNTILSSVNFGINVNINSANTLSGLNITDNLIDSSGSSGIALANAGTGGIIDNAVISGNTLSNNAKTTGSDALKSGIYVGDTLTGAIMSDNYCYDNGSSTQKYGITIASGITSSNTMVTGNKINENTTTGLNIVGTLTGWVTNNWGYNPIGMSSVTPGASPWTYTAGNTPEVLYLLGGTVSGVVKNSITIATALSATQSLPIALDPGEQVIVTYSGVPTANKDQK